MTTEEYIALITQEHRPRPRYEATVRASVEPLAGLQAVMRKFVRDFDVDEAIGAQLDTIGRWVGIDRTVDVPVSDRFFSWDYSVETGWDRGEWEGIGDDRISKYQLPDESYRRVIYGKIILNSWKGRKGTIEEAYAVYDTSLPEAGQVRIIDGGRCTRPPKIFTWDKLEHGWDEAVWDGDEASAALPIFAFDTQGRGWDESAWDGADESDLQRIFTWLRRGYGWDEASWAGTSIPGDVKVFMWDTDGHGWDAAWWDGDWSSGGGGVISAGSDMNVWVLVRDGAFPLIDETLVTSGFIPFRLAGVNVTYGTF